MNIDTSTYPPPVTGENCYGFARHSIEVRLLDVLKALVEKKESGVEQRHIQPLIDEIKQNARLTPIKTGPDTHLFNAPIERHLHPTSSPRVPSSSAYSVAPNLPAPLTWLSAPWLFAELYFYRRLYDALGFFRHETEIDPETGRQRPSESYACLADPFAPAKTHQLQQALPIAERAAILVLDFLDVEATRPSPPARLSRDLFFTLMNESLWGNKADLSHNPTGQHSAGHEHASHMESEQLILLNSSEEAYHFLTDLLNPDSQRRPPRFEFVVDNVGIDIIADLMLATVLTVQGDTGQQETMQVETQHPPHPRVIVHVKAFPVFVSDATRPDFEQMLLAFEEESDEAEIDAGVGLDGAVSESIDQPLPVAGRRRKRYPNLARIAQLWRQFLESGQWQVSANTFWTSPAPFWELPCELVESWKDADLIFIKGDANYRRVHGDLRWPFDTPTSTIAAPLLDLTNLLLVRTLKSETASGLPKERTDQLSAEHSNLDWLSNGKFGVIQLLKKKAAEFADGNKK